MPTTQTVLPNPPFGRDSTVDPRSLLAAWMTEVQNANPLREVDTTAGPYSEAPPPPGVNSTTGLSAQDQEITFVKKSNDANVFTLTGGTTFPQGPKTLTAQYDHFKIKSNGTIWYISG